MPLPDPIEQIRNEVSEPVVRYLELPAARPFVWVLKKTPITPNQVTFLSALLAIAAAGFVSRGDPDSMMHGGLIFAFSRILDSVDGELARVKGMASDWGRLVDTIGDIVSTLAMLTGLWIGLPSLQGSVLLLAFLVLLRGATFDYHKLSTLSRVQHGYDFFQRETQKTFRKILSSPSWSLKLYYYYIQAQQLPFYGRWTSLKQYAETRGASALATVWTEEQRLKHYQNNKAVIILWSWNGADLIGFLIVILSIFSLWEPWLVWINGFMSVQFILTIALHHTLTRNNEEYS